jgi:hypothetical protein
LIGARGTHAGKHRQAGWSSLRQDWTPLHGFLRLDGIAKDFLPDDSFRGLIQVFIERILEQADLHLRANCNILSFRTWPTGLKKPLTLSNGGNGRQ